MSIFSYAFHVLNSLELPFSVINGIPKYKNLNLVYHMIADKIRPVYNALNVLTISLTLNDTMNHTLTHIHGLLRSPPIKVREIKFSNCF